MGYEQQSIDKMLDRLDNNPENKYLKEALTRAVSNLATRNELAAAADFSQIVHSLLGPKGNIATGQGGKNAPVTTILNCSSCGASIKITA